MKISDVRAMTTDQLTDELEKLKKRAIQSAFSAGFWPVRKTSLAFAKSVGISLAFKQFNQNWQRSPNKSDRCERLNYAKTNSTRNCRQ